MNPDTIDEKAEEDNKEIAKSRELNESNKSELRNNSWIDDIEKACATIQEDEKSNPFLPTLKKEESSKILKFPSLKNPQGPCLLEVDLKRDNSKKPSMFLRKQEGEGKNGPLVLNNITSDETDNSINNAPEPTNLHKSEEENKAPLFKSNLLRKSPKRNTISFIPSYPRISTGNESLSQKSEKKINTGMKRNSIYKTIQMLLKEEEAEENSDQEAYRQRKEKEELYKLPFEFRKQFYRPGEMNKPDPFFLEAVEMSEIQKLLVDFELLKNLGRFGLVKKQIQLNFLRVRAIAKKASHNNLYESITIFVILLNCFSFIIDKSESFKDYREKLQSADKFFFVYFVIEISIKIFGLGVIQRRDAFFRDGWNIFDFIVVFLMVLASLLNTVAIDIALLRTLRILKPIKALAQIKELQIILSALFSALPLLMDTILLLFFFYFIYAVAGVQLFSGVLSRRCFKEETGIPLVGSMCGNVKCPSGYYCGKVIDPDNYSNNNVMNFDNVIYSSLQVFLIITLDGWTDTMYSIQKSFSNYSWVYFVSLVIIGTFVLLNLTLAVVKVKFTESQYGLRDSVSGRKKVENVQNTVEVFDLYNLKKQGKWLKARPVVRSRSIVMSKEVSERLTRDLVRKSIKSNMKKIKSQKIQQDRIRMREENTKKSVKLRSKSVYLTEKDLKAVAIPQPQKIVPLFLQKMEKRDSLLKNLKLEKRDSILKKSTFQFTSDANSPSPRLKSFSTSKRFSGMKINILQTDNTKKTEVFEPTSRLSKANSPSKRRKLSSNASEISISEDLSYQQESSSSDANEDSDNKININILDKDVQTPIKKEAFEKLNEKKIFPTIDEGKESKTVKFDSTVLQNGNYAPKYESDGSNSSESESSDESEPEHEREGKPPPSHNRRKRRITYDSLFTVKKSILTFISFWKSQITSKREIEPKYLTLRVKVNQPYEPKSKEDVLVTINEKAEAKRKLEKENILKTNHYRPYFILRNQQQNQAFSFTSQISAINGTIRDFKSSGIPSMITSLVNKAKQQRSSRVLTARKSIGAGSSPTMKKNSGMIRKFEKTLKNVLKSLNIPWFDSSSSKDGAPDTKGLPIRKRRSTVARPMYTMAAKQKTFERNLSVNFLGSTAKPGIEKQGDQSDSDIRINKKVSFAFMGSNSISHTEDEISSNAPSDVDDHVSKTDLFSHLNSLRTIPVMNRRGKVRTKRKHQNMIFRYHEIKDQLSKDYDEDQEEEIKADEEEKGSKIDIEYENLRDEDIKKGQLISYVWSGEDVQPEFQNVDHMNKIFIKLNNPTPDIWIKGFTGQVKIVQNFIKRFLMLKIVEDIILLLIGTLVCFAAGDGFINSELSSLVNRVFTFIFIMEISLKLGSYGIKYFLKDNLNKLDLFVILISIMEIIWSGSMTSFRYSRFFTVAKVFRVFRILRRMTFMKFIVNVLSVTISSFIYLALLIILFLFIYSLLGMQLFGRGFDKNDENYEKYNFDTFSVAYTTNFDIVTMDDITIILEEGFKSRAGPLVTSVYVCFLIFFGNFILLNLFLAILLDAFTQNLDPNSTVNGKLNAVERGIKQASMLNKDIDKEYEEKLREEREIEQQRAEYFEGIYKQRQKFIQGRTDFTTQATTLHIPKTSISIENATGSLLQKRIMEELVDMTRWNNNNTALFPENPMNPNNIKAEQLRIGKWDHNELEESECVHSLGIFSKQSPVRRFCYFLSKKGFYKKTNTLTIIVICLKLALDTYIEEEGYLGFLSQIIDISAFCVFILDAVIKIIIHGLFVERGTYLKSKWNVMDFFLSVSMVINRITDRRTQGFIYGLTLLVKTLTPIRLLTRYKNFRAVIDALLDTLGKLLNVLFLIIVVWVMFGIFGIILYRDRFGYCEKYTNFGVSKAECLENNKNWINYPSNFDNIRESLLTLFIVSTLDNWYEIMSIAVNSDLPEYGPSRYNNQYTTYIFFFSFILFATLFLINLFMGVMFYNFSINKHSFSQRVLTQSQQCWIHLQKMIVLAEANYHSIHPPTSLFRRRIFDMINNRRFDHFITVCILLSVLPLAIFYEGLPDDFVNTLDKIDFVFISIFFVECLLKIIGLGLRGYFYNTWNKFDFVIMFLSVADILFDNYLRLFDNLIDLGPKLLRAARALRLARLLRIMKNLKNLQKLVRTLLFSLPMLINVLVVILVVFFIYTLLGCFLFGKVEKGEVFDDYINFKNFAYGIMTLFKVSTADKWGNVMYDTMREYSLAPLYFVSFYLISTIMLTNLLILILLQQFEEYYFNPNNPLHTFKENLEEFRRKWSIYSSEYQGIKMHHKYIGSFFRRMIPPLGLGMKATDLDLKKHIANLRVKQDRLGYIYFNDLLYASSKRLFQKSQINEKTDSLARKELKKQEQKTIMKLELKKRSRRKLLMSKDKLAYLPAKDTYKPLEIHFNLMTSFLTWMRYSQRTLTKLEETVTGAIVNNAAEYTEYSDMSDDHPNKNKIRACFIEFTEGLILEGLHPPSRDENAIIISPTLKRRHSIVVNNVTTVEPQHPFLVAYE